MQKPVAIPPEILALKNAKLPERLLLAVYAADPATTRVLRAMSMTRAGLRKLEQRLIDKRLLSVAGARHMVHVPGLVCIDHGEGGHFVPVSSTTKSAKKVASRASKTAQAEGRPLVVPAELLEFRYLSAAEKVLLAYYVANPSAPNGRVVKTLGVSSSGLKKLKRGLLDKGVLVKIEGAYAIRLPGLVLVRDSDGGHLFPESEALNRGHKVAHPAPKLTPAKDLYDYWKSSLKKMCRQPDTTPSFFLSMTTKTIRRIEVESPVTPEREAALSKMKRAENVFFARDFVYDNIPRKYEAKFMELVNSATPEQLAALREKAEGMMRVGLPEPRLLGMVTKAIAPVPAQNATPPRSVVAHGQSPFQNRHKRHFRSQPQKDRSYSQNDNQQQNRNCKRASKHTH